MPNIIDHSSGDLSQPIAAPVALPITSTSLPAVGTINRRVLSRRLAYIMLVRVLLYTLVLGGTVTMHLVWNTPEVLGGTYVHVLFVFIAVIYVLNILFALVQRKVRNLGTMALIQVVTDLIASSMLVHFTGSAESAFVLFFLLSPIAAAVTLSRRAALFTALFGTIFYAATCILGFHHLLPILPEQVQLPWSMTGAELSRSLLLYGSAMFAVALLAGYLAEQLRSTVQRVIQQQATLDDLAALNADIIRCLSSGLITIDAQGLVLTMNQAAADILGLKGESSSQYLRSLIPDFASIVAQTQDQQRPEVALNIAGETKIIGLSVSPLTDRQNVRTGSIINFQDLTMLREMEQTMKRSEHLATVGRLAAGIAHEIRNPLASISGSLELLGSERGLAPESKRLMNIAQREIERLANLITELLDYARPKGGAFNVVELGETLEPLVARIGNLLPKEQAPRIQVMRQRDDLWVRIDVDQVSALLWNLIHNAWQAGEKEKIEVIVGSEDNENVFLEVRDRGIGIPAEDLPHIFQPFFTTKAKGTGLGLATVKRVVQDHGGSIEVNSRPKQGTTFTILFPRVKSPAATHGQA